MSFKYNNKTKEYDVHGTVTMYQFVNVWNSKRKKPIHIFGDGIFNYNDVGRKFKLTQVIVDDKGKFHANFLTFDKPEEAKSIINHGNCEIGCGSAVSDIENHGIMIISKSRVEGIHNYKYLELKNKSIGSGIINFEKSCIKTVGSIIIDSWADLSVKVWQGNSIYLGCDSTIIPKYPNKFEVHPYTTRNHPSLSNILSSKAANADQVLYTRIAYFISHVDQRHLSVVTAEMAAIENLINANSRIRLSHYLAANLLIHGQFTTKAVDVVKILSTSGYGLSYPK